MDTIRTEMSTRCIISHKMENKNATLSKQFHNLIAKSQLEAISVPLTHKYMTSQFLGLA